MRRWGWQALSQCGQHHQLSEDLERLKTGDDSDSEFGHTASPPVALVAGLPTPSLSPAILQLLLRVSVLHCEFHPLLLPQAQGLYNWMLLELPESPACRFPVLELLSCHDVTRQSGPCCLLPGSRFTRDESWLKERNQDSWWKRDVITQNVLFPQAKMTFKWKDITTGTGHNESHLVLTSQIFRLGSFGHPGCPSSIRWWFHGIELN